jgi:predicted permease
MLLSLLLPLFLLAGLGALLVKTGWLGTSWAGGVNALTAKLLIPALLFNGMLKNGLPAAVSWQVLAAYYVPLLLLFGALAMWSGRDAARALAGTFSNTVFVGIPVLRQALGEASLQFAFPVIAFHGLIAFSAYYALAAGGGRLLPAIGNAVMNPIVASLLAGLALNLSGLALPHALSQLLDMLASAALPCSLLALGASLATLRLQEHRVALLLVAAKLFALPLLVLGATLILHLPADATAVLVVLAACPVGVNVAAVVQGDGKDPALATSAILVSSLACTATLPGWLWLLSMIG